MQVRSGTYGKSTHMIPKIQWLLNDTSAVILDEVSKNLCLQGSIEGTNNDKKTQICTLPANTILIWLRDIQKTQPAVGQS